MVGIVEDWIFRQLGLNFNLNDIPDNNIFQDGCVLFDILQKYGLLDANFGINITPTTDGLQCKKNLRSLKPLFDMLNIDYSESVMHGIVESKVTIIRKLLYELFICLENKQHLYFITKQNYEKIHNKNRSDLDDFKINCVESETLPEVNNKLCFELPLIKNREIIEWYKNKYNLSRKTLKQHLILISDSKLLYKNSRHKHENQRGNCECSCRPNSFNDSETVKNLPDFDIFLKCYNTDNLLNYEQFISSFKAKQQKLAAKRCFEDNIQNCLLEETWSRIMKRQRDMYNSLFAEVMLKQSQYEKQILKKLIEADAQVNIQNENQKELNRKVLNIEETEINRDLKLKEDFEELKKMYDAEQKRVMELHKKLYSKKQDIKKKEHDLLCRQIIDDVINIATYKSEYTSEYGVDVPKTLWSNWKQLFVKSQPIHIPFKNLECKVLEGQDIDYLDIITSEKELDDVLNENDVEEYVFTCGRWFYTDISLSLGNVDENCLSYIVHRLLSIKYPPPPSHLPAELPLFKVAGVLINFHSVDYIEKLKILLSKSNIHVFDSETAIKKCIDTYQKEIAIPTDDNAKKRAHKDKNKKIPVKEKKIGTKSKAKSKKGKGTVEQKDLENNVEVIINLNDKETQTSLNIEKDKCTERTALGLIGEEILTLLKNGDKINDDTLVSVIIEYLKSQEDVDGWLLLNYPQTIQQASVIELKLTGKQLPLPEGQEESESPREDKLDEFTEKRKSRILPLPMYNKDEDCFKTHFSSFVIIKEEIPPNPSIIENNNTSLNNNDEVSFTNQEVEQLEKTPLDIVELFYESQSILKEFYCTSLDLMVLKSLARVILKKESKEDTTSVDLFGEEALSKLMKGKKEKNKEEKSPKSNKKQKSDKNRKLSRKKTQSSQMDKVKSVEPEVLNEDDVIEHTNLTIDEDKDETEALDLEPKVVNPGDNEWKNVALPIDTDLAIILATMWENIENSYLTNLKDILFENRMINLRLVPYSTYTQNEINLILSKPDIKQNLVNVFQSYYNSIENDIRTITDVKVYLHCKVLQLQQNLWQVTENLKEEAESKRKDIINDDWLVNEVCMLINNFLCLIQVEFDRSLETMKLINDYYMSMNKNIPILELNIPPVATKPVVKITKAVFLAASADDSRGNTETNFVAQCLTNCEEKGKTFDLLNVFLPNQIEDTVEKFNSVAKYFKSQIKIEENALTVTNKKGLQDKKELKDKKESKGKKSIANSKAKTQKQESVKLKKSTLTKQSRESETKQLSNSEQLLKEWSFVIDAEQERLICRLNLISARAQEDITEFFCFLESVFCELRELILNTYNNDISNIDRLCDYIRTAIEEESPLIKPLILDREQFFIESDNSFIFKSEKEFKVLEEEIDYCRFTVNQLSRLKHIFHIAGPFGHIRKQPLCYILQDLISFNSEENQPNLPEIWSFLSETQLRTVIDTMFGTEYTIGWRDFIIYNLEIPYPTIDEILSLRNKFLSHDYNGLEVISVEHYENTTLWFEKDLPANPKEGLRFALAKKLLSELFKVGENEINYTALLLHFCKDFDPKLGLRKALCLSVGKNVITSKEELEEILKDEAELKETMKELVQGIIDSVVQSKEGVLIYEIYESVSTMRSIGSKESSSHTPTHSKISENEVTSIIESKSTSPSSIIQGHDQSSTWWVSHVPAAAVMSILNALFSNQDNTSYSIRDLYLSFVEEMVNNNDTITGHELMEFSYINKVLTMTKRFTISMPCDIVRNCLKDVSTSV